jgi:hypothetical protein
VREIDELSVLVIGAGGIGSEIATRFAALGARVVGVRRRPGLGVATDGEHHPGGGQRGASDLHIKAGDVFRARIDGSSSPSPSSALTPEQTRAIALRLIPHEATGSGSTRSRTTTAPGGARRGALPREPDAAARLSFMIVMRVIPFEIPTFEQLKLLPIGGEGHRQPGAGAGAGDRRHRLGEEQHEAALIGYMNQHHAQAHRHPGEPDRVPAPRPQLLHHAARGRRRHRLVPVGLGRRCGRTRT